MIDKDAQIKLLQQHCRTAWSRGYTVGKASMESQVSQAVEALRIERKARADDNAYFTQLLDKYENLSS